MMKGICQVSFVKVKDGSNRVIYCTLNGFYIPDQFSKSIEKIFSEQPSDPDIIPVWDIAEGKWKSFRLSKMNFFLTSDELESENKIGHSTRSELADLLKKRKQEAQEKFQQRVQDLKNKAKQASQNINGELQNED
jgi:hypothetical protein